MRGENDGAAALGDLAEELHDFFFGGRIESRGRLVQKDHRRFCDQLDGNRNALALAAGKLAHGHVAALRQTSHVHHFIDYLIDFPTRHVARQTQTRHVVKRAIDGQLAVNDVVLRHVTD